MPKVIEVVERWPKDQELLAGLGVVRMDEFCKVNGIPAPGVFSVSVNAWYFGSVCAFYRPDTDAVRDVSVGEEKMRERGYGPGINICITHCGRLAPHEVCRNWSWPGNDTDREPYGVIAHELGHHCDWFVGKRKWEYGSEYCEEVMEGSGEKPLTSYAAANPAEWFAEAFRLFVTNYGLLAQLRPRTFDILSRKWEPVGTSNWIQALGENVPERIVTNLMKKGAKPC